MSIDTSKIKAGDRVQIANGDWFEVEQVMPNSVWLCGFNGRYDKAIITDHRPASEPVPEPSVTGSLHSNSDNVTEQENRYRASEPVPKLERDPMCDAEWEHLLKTAQRGRIMEVDGLKMQLVEANALLRQWRKLYDLGIEDFMPSFAHPVVGELYDKTRAYLNDINPKEPITMEELEATNRAVEELTSRHHGTQSGEDLSEKRHNPSLSSEKPTPVSDGLEWLTASEWLECGNEAVNRGSDAQDYADTINALLTRKLKEGKLPVVSKADVAKSVQELQYILARIREGDGKQQSAINYLASWLTDLLDGGAK